MDRDRASSGDRSASYGPPGQVDVELLRQRAAFLRPDSLVAVVVLTDEDDSSADPLSFEGTAGVFESDVAATRAPPAACARIRLRRRRARRASSCRAATEATAGLRRHEGGVYTAAEDVVNVRFHQMKQRFGVDPQFPISRYVDALHEAARSRARDSEHAATAPTRQGRLHEPALRRAPAHASRRRASASCRAGRAPATSCTSRSSAACRTSSSPTSGESSRPSTGRRSSAGSGALRRDRHRPAHDPVDRRRAPACPGPARPTAPIPINGREWDTGGTDLEFACTFDLFETPDGTIGPRASRMRRRPCDKSACDCDGTKTTPLCDPADNTVQIKGKAYPTRRELTVAKELGDHGIVASLCPKQLTAPDADDYGYRPAVRAITQRLEAASPPRASRGALARDGANGSVPCLVLATLAEPGSQDECTKLGLELPTADSSRRSATAPRRTTARPRGPPAGLRGAAGGRACRASPAATRTKRGLLLRGIVPGSECSQSINCSRSPRLVDRREFSLQCITLEGKH